MNDSNIDSIVSLPLPRLQVIQPADWHDMEAAVWRVDEIHPIISGNKWYKLSGYLRAAQAQQLSHLVTYGGPWSNHLVATAAAAQAQGWTSEGRVRGEEPRVWSSTLQECRQLGMQLVFLPRDRYRQESAQPPQESAAMVIPAGGAGPLGIEGASTMVPPAIMESFTHIIAAVGTGTMVSGIISVAPRQVEVIGIPVLKGTDQLTQEIQHNLQKTALCSWRLAWGHDAGGYGKHSPDLITFMAKWYRETGIPTDFVYTGKMFMAIDQWVRSGYFPPASRLLCIHSGGLQGNRSLPNGSLPF
jgi:1-aminocyclopropane-1-carboxylate deaminase